MECSLCRTCHDSIDHLFFECPYSSKIWKTMKGMMKQHDISDNWESINQRMAFERLLWWNANLLMPILVCLVFLSEAEAARKDLGDHG
ncbi:hypothetical protein Tco_0635262 [Tanacetum coccineum]